MLPSGTGKITHQGHDIADLRLFSVFISDSPVERVICERDVVAAIVATSSRMVAVSSSISDNRVVVAIVDEGSRRMFKSDSVVEVVIEIVEMISRNIRTFGVDVSVVDGMFAVSARRMFKSDVDMPVVVAMAAASSRMYPSIISFVAVVVAIVDVRGRRMFTSDVDADVVVAIVVTSSRVAAPAAMAMVDPHVPRVTSSVPSKNSNSYSLPSVAPEQSSPNCNSDWKESPRSTVSDKLVPSISSPACPGSPVVLHLKLPVGREAPFTRTVSAL